MYYGIHLSFIPFILRSVFLDFGKPRISAVSKFGLDALCNFLSWEAATRLHGYRVPTPNILYCHCPLDDLFYSGANRPRSSTFDPPIEPHAYRLPSGTHKSYQCDTTNSRFQTTRVDSRRNPNEETRVLPSLASIYPYLLDSASETQEDRNGICADLFNNNHYMFLIRPSPPGSALAEVRIRPLALIPERKYSDADE